MARIKSLRRATALVSVLLVVVAGAGVYWALSSAPQAATVSADVPVAPEASCDADFVGPTLGKPCKPCKDRPWCECTYNGAPRISCDPCCYNTQPWPTCMD